MNPTSHCYIDAKALEGDLSVRRLYGLVSRCLSEVAVRFRLEDVIRRIARSLRGVHVLGSGVDLSIYILSRGRFTSRIY